MDIKFSVCNFSDDYLPLHKENNKEFVHFPVFQHTESASRKIGG